MRADSFEAWQPCSWPRKVSRAPELLLKSGERKTEAPLSPQISYKAAATRTERGAAAGDESARRRNNVRSGRLTPLACIKDNSSGPLKLQLDSSRLVRNTGCGSPSMYGFWPIACLCLVAGQRRDWMLVERGEQGRFGGMDTSVECLAIVGRPKARLNAYR